MPELNYAGIMAAGQTLVPDLQAQLIQREQLALQQQQVDAQRANTALAVNKFRTDQAEQAAFQTDLTAALSSKDPTAIPRLMAKYPKMADGLSKGWDALDKSTRTTNLTQIGSIIGRIQSKDFEGAGTLLEQRIAADKEAGQDTTEEEHALRLLRSGDPEQQQAAMAGMKIIAYSANPEGYSGFLETIGASDKGMSATMREYNERVLKFGKPEADKWLAVQDSKLVPVAPGGSVYNAADFVAPNTAPTTPSTQPKGGDPASAGPVSLIDPLRGNGHTPVQGGQYGASRDYGAHRATDLPAPIGTPIYSAGGAGMVRVGKSDKGGNIVTIDHGNGMVTRYMHLGQVNVQNGQRVGPNDVIGTVGKTGRATGPNLHYEAIWRGKKIDPGHFGHGATPQVKTKQQYDRLPVGAAYIAPDGSHRTKI
jgi:hypothetical protein